MNESIPTAEQIRRLLAVNLPAERFEKPFTMPCIFGRQHHENFISDWLAYLMDPAKCGYGVDVLNALLFCCDGANLAIDRDTAVDIRREYALKNGRRIDFVAFVDREDNRDPSPDEFDGVRARAVIAIENKIRSGENNGQLSEYLRSVKGGQGKSERIMILLVPKGNGAFRGKRPPGYAVVWYEAFIERLKRVNRSNGRSLRDVFLLEEFIQHMEAYTMEQSLAVSEELKVIIQNQKQLRKINELYKGFENAVRERLVKRIHERLQRDGEDAWEIARASNYILIHKPGWKTGPVFAHYELLLDGGENFATAETVVIAALHIEGRDPAEKRAIRERLGLEKPLPADGFTMRPKNSMAASVCEMAITQCYDSEERINANLDALVAALGRLDSAYTARIDAEMARLKLEGSGRM